jgi:hypothetical protein
VKANRLTQVPAHLVQGVPLSDDGNFETLGDVADRPPRRITALIVR